MIELEVLKALLIKDNWVKYRRFISKPLNKEFNVLLSILDNYFTKNENAQNLSIEDFEVVAEISGKVDSSYKDIFVLIKNLKTQPILIEELLKSYKEKDLLTQLALAAYDTSEGKKPAVDIKTLYNELETLTTEGIQENEFEVASDDLDFLLEETYTKHGLRWRLNSLNASLGSLRKGDFGFIFARPETGKTTFLASEVSFMAQHTDGNILWINNEEETNKVKVRVFQALLGANKEQLENPAGRTKAKEMYATAVQDRLKIINAQGGITANQVEKLCEQYHPKLIILDQIDKIEGFEDDREDLKLGAIYIWARRLSSKYGPVIAVTQADGSGDNCRWLNMNNVANAKTSKQAEADWILGIGKIHDIGYESVRFLHISKNKLVGDKDTDPTKRHFRCEVSILPHIARYKDIHLKNEH